MTYHPSEKYSYLIYFLKTYWHQNSDLMYDHDIRKAAQDFKRVENDEFSRGLAADIQRALEDKVFGDSFDDPRYKEDWWHQFDNDVVKKQALDVMMVLGAADKLH